LDPKERFNLFKKYLKEPSLLKLEERRGIYERLALAPPIFERFAPLPSFLHPLWPLRLEVEKEFAQGSLWVHFGWEFDSRELTDNFSWCTRVMESGIFYRGGLKKLSTQGIGEGRFLPIEHLESFVRDLAASLKYFWVHREENLINSIMKARNDEAEIHFTHLEKSVELISYIPSNLARRRITPAIEAIERLKWNIQNSWKSVSKAYLETIKKDNKFNIVLILAFIIDMHIPTLRKDQLNIHTLRKDQLAKRLEELLTYFNYQVSFAGIKKELQRSYLF
jgi:hypothetical protein